MNIETESFTTIDGAHSARVEAQYRAWSRGSLAGSTDAGLLDHSRSVIEVPCRLAPATLRRSTVRQS